MSSSKISKEQLKALPAKERRSFVVTCFVLILGIPFALVYHGFVIQTLWNWFAVDGGASTIGLGSAIGIMLILALATFQTQYINKSTDWIETIRYMVKNTWWLPTWTLLVGALIHYVF